VIFIADFLSPGATWITSPGAFGINAGSTDLPPESSTFTFAATLDPSFTCFTATGIFEVAPGFTLPGDLASILTHPPFCQNPLAPMTAPSAR